MDAPIWTISTLLNTRLPGVPLSPFVLDGGELRKMAQREIDLAFGHTMKGEPLTSGDRPDALVFLDPTADADNDWLLDLLAPLKTFRHLGQFYVSGDVANALGEFDLGDGGLFDIPILQSDLATPFDVSFSMLGYWNNRDTVDRENTPRCKPVYPDTPGSLYKLPLNLTGRDVYVHPSAVDGPDMWFDPMITNVQFVSDRVAQALIAAGVDQDFEINQCQHVPDWTERHLRE